MKTKKGLILTRVPGETIIVGDNIYISILDVVGHRVRLLIDAPRDIRVDREEIRDRINLETEDIPY